MDIVLKPPVVCWAFASCCACCSSFSIRRCCCISIFSALPARPSMAFSTTVCPLSCCVQPGKATGVAWPSCDESPGLAANSHGVATRLPVSNMLCSVSDRFLRRFRCCCRKDLIHGLPLLCIRHVRRLVERSLLVSGEASLVIEGRTEDSNVITVLSPRFTYYGH